MTDSVFLPAEVGFAAPVSDSADAFRRARSHSARVRVLRVAIPVGAIGGCLAIGLFVIFDPFRAVLPSNVSIDGAGLSGTRVTMAHPKMSGYRKDGRPYSFTAEEAVQDLKAPNVLELNKLDAHVTMTGASVAHITAMTGVYDASRELMDLKGDVHLQSDAGYDVRMNTAHIEFKGNNVTSREPVTVVMKTGTVSAGAMAVTNNGAQITFTGDVHSVMLPAAARGLDTEQPKGTEP